jgi:hypothetical protein
VSQESTFEDTYQSIYVCAPVGFEILQNRSLLHPRGYHAERVRESVTVDTDEREDEAVVEALPNERFSEKLLQPRW